MSVSPVTIEYRNFLIEPVVTDVESTRWMATEESIDTPEFFGDTLADIQKQIDAHYAKAESKMRAHFPPFDTVDELSEERAKHLESIGITRQASSAANAVIGLTMDELDELKREAWVWVFPDDHDEFFDRIDEVKASIKTRMEMLASTAANTRNRTA